MTMVNHSLETMEHVYVEIEPGDALFFHSNILHRSEANLSDKHAGQSFPAIIL
jgi:ectoine hydroxylase-related dioxygenase (phytanoyl-CoA dioxygenase family)